MKYFIIKACICNALGFYFYFCMSFENEFTFVSYLNKVFILAKHSVFIGLLLCGFILSLIIFLLGFCSEFTFLMNYFDD